MSFIDGKPRVATDEHLAMRWCGDKPGKCFRCAMCGHKFEVGDVWRFVYANGTEGTAGNFLVCVNCDGPDVLDRMVAMVKEAKTRFWWFTRSEASS